MPEVLSLNKKQKNKKKLFKPFVITDVGGRVIGIVQSSFESFWGQINRIDATNHEKQQCLDRLKEACSWMCRGVAQYNQVQDDEKEDIKK